MRVRIAFFLFCLAAPFCCGGEATYELHEWGVFPVPRNAAWAMLDTRAELSTMPDFFFMVWPKERLPWHGPVTKPVIYFYPTSPLEVKLKIRFADGRPLVWWPAASSPVAGYGDEPANVLDYWLRVGEFAPPGSSERKRLDAMAKDGTKKFSRGSLDLKEMPMPEVEKGHWVETLRAVPSAKIFTSGGHSMRGYDGDQVEKFIYYDGLMKAPATPQLARDGDALVVRSNYPYAISDLMVIDRDGAHTRIGKAWTNVAAGEQTTRLEQIPAGDAKGDPKFIATVAEDFVKHLVAAGLTQEESVALEKVWHAGLFQHEGLNLFYRVPQETYDAWLPLTADPKPLKIVRVGIVLHQHLEPELEANVAALIKKLGADEFDTRQSAMQALMTIGGAAFPYLEAAIKSPAADIEIANCCRKILEMLDARKGLESPKEH